MYVKRRYAMGNVNTQYLGSWVLDVIDTKRQNGDFSLLVEVEIFKIIRNANNLYL